MKKTVKTFDSLRDSRILFDKQPPLFGYIIIIIVLLFLCGAVVWSIITPKIYTIQSQGLVTNENANYVMCAYTGEIDEYYMQEGAIVQQGDVLFTVKSTDYDLQEQQLLESKKSYEEQIAKNELLVKSIKDDVNYFDEENAEDSLYYSSYETYKAKVEQSTVDTSTYKAYGYTDEQIQAELVKNQSKIDEIYYSSIQSAENAISQAQQQISSIDAQLAAVTSGQAAYTVKAPTSGILHILGNYKSGMVVQTTNTVATITPENSQRVIECYVSTADMARMKEKDTVQVVVDGLSQSVYGTLTGTVEHIDSNVTTQQGENGNNVQTFKVLISVDTDYLVSKSGDKVDIVNGMTAVARIQYDKVTYFNYVLEKLGFKSK